MRVRVDPAPCRALRGCDGSGTRLMVRSLVVAMSRSGRFACRFRKVRLHEQVADGRRTFLTVGGHWGSRGVAVGGGCDGEGLLFAADATPSDPARDSDSPTAIA